jgi:hypothetical protein
MVLHHPHKTMKNKPELFSLYLQNVMIDYDNEFEMEKLKQILVKEKKSKKKPGNKL